MIRPCQWVETIFIAEEGTPRNSMLRHSLKVARLLNFPTKILRKFTDELLQKRRENIFRDGEATI